MQVLRSLNQADIQTLKKEWLMATDPSNDDFEIIPSDSVESSSRGRKPSPDALRIADALQTLKTGQAILVKSLQVNLNDKDSLKARARNSAIIRSGAKRAGVNVKITFRPSDGVPQVEVVK
jgi:hypothetical protein